MYPFMVKHLGLETKGVLDQKTGKYDETKNTIEATATMRNFSSAAEMPSHALKPNSVVAFD